MMRWKAWESSHSNAGGAVAMSDPCGKLVLEEGASLALVLLPSLTMGSQSRTCNLAASTSTT
jgi:hypothetical protein